MASKWLSLFFKLSAKIFKLKEKMIGVNKWYQAVFYALIIFLIELCVAVVSLPLYFFVPPKKLQQRGWFFPAAEVEPVKFKNYIVRRKVSLVTILGAGGIFIIKVAFVAVVSFYLLGAQQLLAATQNWTFDTASDYTYDSAKIEVTGGVARLKDTGSTSSGNTTNSGFDSGSTGWTYASWQHYSSGSNSGSYQSSGGNPGGYVNVNLNVRKNQSEAGYWYQSFTTTVDSPDTATLNLDWKSISFGGTVTTYRLYAFIDTSSGAPTLGTQVWDSGEITGTTSWASATPINIKSKLPTAGTYYLKIGAYITRPNGGSNNLTYISGFDNVAVNWSKVTHSYASDNPTIKPNTSLTMAKTVSWDSFTETATKNGGEIYYQLSDDDGSTWKYWNDSTWATAGATNYNIASTINSNINTFSTSSNKIMWKAFLYGNGSQQVILDNVAVTYTENTPPVATNLTPAQDTNYGYVNVGYNLQDANSDPSSLVSYEYSLTGAFAGEQTTMIASSTDPAHSGTTNLSTSPIGVSHTFVWDAKSQLGEVYNTSVYVRLRANDGIQSGAYATSSVFTVDYVNPAVSNVVAAQTLGSSNVVITYDLADDTSDNLTVELQISGDGGSTWTVPATSVTGAVGTGITTGTGKTITWAAGTDYSGQQKNNLQVRVKAKDKWQNQGSFTSSANFFLDTLNPAAATTTELQSQPNAGDTTVLLGGSFTETNPNTNDFYVAIDGGSYGTATAGTTNTATPANQATAVGATLDGNDYISTVKIIHTDDYGNIEANENVTPNVAYKYVKPYTPGAPTLSNPVTTRLDLLINEAGGEAGDLQYAVQEVTTGKYLQSNGTLDSTITWQVLGTASGEWGNGLGVRGKVRITGLSSPVSQYVFKVKSRNPSDSAHAVSSESSFSAIAQITNTAPSLSLNSYTQTTDGTKYVPIDYIGTDGQGDISNLSLYEYSLDNSLWHTLTEKTGVGSNGVSNLIFLPTGSSYNLAWDSGTDLGDLEDTTVYIRLRPNDSLVNGSTVTSAALEIDQKKPVISNVSASQNIGSHLVTITYDLADANNSNVELNISSDGGATWTVATSSASGAVGSWVVPANGKVITWNASVDFDDQYNTNMKVRVRARDSFGNQGDFSESSVFVVDTHDPIVTNVTASQDVENTTFTFTYDVAEDNGNVTVSLEISADNGSTWTVPTGSAAGDIGTVTPGNGKVITWNGATNYNNQEKTAMKIRLTVVDTYNNTSVNTSSNFSLDTKAPRITNVTASQILGSANVSFNYDLADQNNSLVEIDISSDEGLTWDVVDTSVTGDVGVGITAGTGKNIVWSADTDFDEHQLASLKVRMRAKDIFNNQSANVNSANFSLDTLNPAAATTTELQSQPNAGDTTVLLGGSFTEANPNTNDFNVAIDGGSYGTATVGTTNTATPANQATAVGATLDGNDFISTIKIVHTDDYGQAFSNENTSPSVTYKYVKPYTPATPVVDNPTVGTVDVLISKNVAETDGLEYAIYESSQSKYVQANGTLGESPVWQTLGTGVGQWGNLSGVLGKITVNGLTTHSYLYQFQTKSRNSSDAAHAASSESNLSAGASSVNQSPIINLTSFGQTTDGTRYVTINYNGFDLEAETANLVDYQYSRDNVTWHSMTEKSGVGSDGITNLAFSNSGSGTTHDFMWDVDTDLLNIEDDTVYVRLRANDGTSNGNYSTSATFVIDTKNPIISSVAASQILGSGNVGIDYTLTDLSNSSVEFQISEDAGSSWVVATSTHSGDVGGGVVPGLNKNIVWGASTDFFNQEQNDLRTRLRATDAYGNIGSFVSSSNFNIDTKVPTITSITASQNLGYNTVAITYTLADANSSNVEIDISEDNGATWGVADVSVTGDIGSGITSGNKNIVWDAATDFPNRDQGNMKIRLRATDSYNNLSNNVESGLFSVDTKAPVVSNVSAAQLSGSRYVAINYDLSDLSLVKVEMDISADGGSSWTVSTTTTSGDIGSGISQGSNKVIIWNAGTDFDNQDNTNLRVRVRGLDPYNNSSGNIESSNFSLDTKNPTVSTPANLTSQPQAGDTAVSISVAFTESNPNTNEFLVAIDGGLYNATTTGDADTATPANQATAVGATLDGNDYISQIKVIHTDDFNQIAISENSSLDISLKYVKPYTPATPAVDNPTVGTVDVLISKNVAETDGLEYAIYESSQNKYVQANGTLGESPVWQTLGTGVGQWGNVLAISGKVKITSLNSPVATYSFKTKSRNSSDTTHTASSESDFSLASGIINTAPAVSIVSASQPSDTNYVLISYTGTDEQNDINNLLTYEYSTDNVFWQTMTEKSGVGSSGTSSLYFSATGTIYTFAWDISKDLPNIEDNTVYVRLKSTDTLAESNLEVSSSLAIDTLGPLITDLNITQTPGSTNLNFDYNLADNSGGGILTELLVSDDGGSTWDVSTTTLTGDIGSGISAGADKRIIWNAGSDWPNHEGSNLKIKIRGQDVYGNWGNFNTSVDFSADTKAPIVSSVVASQASDSDKVNISYTLTDLTSAGNYVEFNVSDDGGSTWVVSTTTFSGAVGEGQVTGSKVFVWDAGEDFSGEFQNDLRVRVRARDYFGNQGSFVSSGNFTLDTLSPIISNINATQTLGNENFTFTYNLTENSSSSTVVLDISADGGLTWNVAATTLAGDLGGGVTGGSTKTISWNAGTDFNGQEKNNMRIRIKATDKFGNQGSYLSSADFSLDTAAPVGLTSLSKFSSTDSSATLNWSSGITDSNFNHYELWYGLVESDVVNATGSAERWTVTEDINLSNILTNSTVITGINLTQNFYVKIFAVDDYGNTSTASQINIYTPSEPVVVPETVVSAGGGAALPVSTIPVKLAKPILTSISSPTKETLATIQGLAEPRSRVDLYDNGVLVTRLESLADNNGLFNQRFSFNPGSHSLTVRTSDFNNNISDFSDAIILNIITNAPEVPVIFSPKNKETISGNQVVVIGSGASRGVIEVNVEGSSFSAPINSDGSWQIVVPNVNQLTDGSHTFNFTVTDQAQNVSQPVSLELNKVTSVAAAGVSGVTTLPGTTTELPIPSARLIEEAAGATEISSLPVPDINNIQLASITQKPNSISFSGSALPNQDVLVYIHSDQALIYRTHTDSGGQWNFTHDQDVVELSPGEHSIYAVAVDTGAKVKSRPSAISFFTVKKSLWVTIYSILNLPTTIVTVIILIITIFWLYRLKKRGVLAT